MRHAAQFIPSQTQTICVLSFRTAFSLSLLPTSTELQAESQLIINLQPTLSVNAKQIDSVLLELVLTISALSRFHFIISLSQASQATITSSLF